MARPAIAALLASPEPLAELGLMVQGGRVVKLDPAMGPSIGRRPLAGLEGQTLTRSTTSAVTWPHPAHEPRQLLQR